MEGKLIKVENGYVLMVDNIMYATDNDKLSLKNCQAIENGYDLDEMACNEIGIDISVINHIDNKVIENDSVSTPIHEAGALGAGLYHRVKGFEIGFQKALELLGDKKFSEKELTMLFAYGHQIGMNTILAIQSQHSPQPMPKPDSDKLRDELIQSLQQTEWDVEIETIEYGLGNDENGRPVFETRNILDADGCLILKRKWNEHTS